jgi:hypothetical protein
MDAEFLRSRTCEGPLRVESAIDMPTGLTVEQYVCVNCGQAIVFGMCEGGANGCRR